MAKKFIFKRPRELMVHQIDIMKYMMERGTKGTALFVEMRLGKTLPVIRFYERLQLSNPILVICPNSVVSTWMRELALENISNVFVLRGAKDRRLALMQEAFNGLSTTPTAVLNKQRNKWVVVNFESVISLDCANFEWGALIIDESYRIASPKSAITKYLMGKEVLFRGKRVFGFSRLPDYRTVLCGNPAPESELNYINQFLVFQKHFLGFLSFYEARYNLFEHNTREGEFLPKLGIKQQIYKSVHRNAYVLTRQQAGIGSKKIYSIREVEMNSSQKKAYESMAKHWEVNGVSTSHAITQVLYLSRLAGGMILSPQNERDMDPSQAEWYSLNKFNEVISLLNSELKNQSVIIWFRFHAEQAKMAEILTQNKITYCMINGDIPVQKREISRLQFQKGEVQVSLMIIETGKVGQDWSKADTAIYFSNEYSCDARTQSEDRIVHPQKTSPLLIIDLITSKSIDEDVLSILKEKKSNSAYFMSKLLYLLKK